LRGIPVDLRVSIKILQSISCIPRQAEGEHRNRIDLSVKPKEQVSGTWRNPGIDIRNQFVVVLCDDHLL